MIKFVERLESTMARNKSLLCVGLDPDLNRMAIDDVALFNEAIIEATADLVCAYKPNFAFYEQLGKEGLSALERTIAAVPDSIPVIADGKRGDIGSTSAAYARTVFDVWGVDAVTVNPFLGHDSLEPFLDYEDRGILILCRTSNPGARDFQDLLVDYEGQRIPLYQHVAQKAQEWNSRQNIGLVVGATYIPELSEVRAICPDMPYLIPGIGAQGGDLEGVVRKGVNRDGRGAIINASRQVLYASKDPKNFAGAARREATTLRDSITQVLSALGKGW